MGDVIACLLFYGVVWVIERAVSFVQGYVPSWVHNLKIIWLLLFVGSILRACGVL